MRNLRLNKRSTHGEFTRHLFVIWEMLGGSEQVLSFNPPYTGLLISQTKHEHVRVLEQTTETFPKTARKQKLSLVRSTPTRSATPSRPP
jgi:hypothetical protein